MSTILKALRRIEDDKTPPPGARPLREEVAAVPGEPLPRRRSGRGRAVGLGGALALVLLGLAVAGGELWLPGGGGERDEPAPARTAAPERGASGPRADASGAAPPTAQTPSAAPAADARDASELAGRSAEGRTASDLARRSAERRTASDLARRSAEAPAPAPPRREPAPPPRDYAAAQTEPPSAPAAPRPTPEPSRPPAAADPEPAVRNIMPELTVAGTVWHPDPGRRTAQVELAGRGEPLSLREGDAVGSLVVKAIEPSGVVFRMGEVEVRRRVGQ